MYEEMIAKVMSKSVALSDWLGFKSFMESVFIIDPRDQDGKYPQKLFDIYASAAFNVASVLSEEEISNSKDIALIIAYRLLHSNPEQSSFSVEFKP